MRLALIGPLRTETLGLFAVVAGILLFLAGYVSGAQSQAALGAASPHYAAPSPVAETAAPECAPSASAVVVAPPPAPRAESSDVVPARRVKATVFKDYQRQ